MIRRNIHPLEQVETVRIEALYTRIELQIFAIVGARLLHQPIEKFAAETK